jgi:Bax protein
MIALGLAVAVLPRSAAAPSWRGTMVAWVGPVSPPARDDAFTLASIEPAALAAGGAGDVFRTFRENGYTLDGVREREGAVPRVLLPRLPRDMQALESSDQRKQVFIKMMLPLLLAENERVLDRRERMIELRHRLETGAPVATTDREWLSALADRYGVDNGDLDELARRVDAIPPSLAIAQAALESGWGTSRAAQRVQNVFGHMAYGGGAPTKPFASLPDAVESYVHNLNIHRGYAGFREQRAKMRADGEVPDGFELARELSRYSERRLDYVRDVRGLIRANNLRPLDRARLDG